MIASEIRTVQTMVGAPTRSRRGASKIRVIALNTFRESVRDRVLYNLILFVLILVGASVFISELSVDQESKFTETLALSAMLVFGALIAIFIGVGLVYKEIDKRTIYNLLSKPVHRHELIIGKYLGLCMTLLVNSAVMMLGTELALLYVNGGFISLHVTALAAGYLIYLELALLVAVALMFSSFTTPLLATLFSFAIYVIGHFSSDLRLAAAISDSALVRGLLTALYYLIPNLSNFGFITEASHGQVVPLRLAISATVYALVYICVLLSASVLIFQRRNFK
ncbi:MAG: ABC transporter permease [Blastocatellia bacterium]|jgi:Cu-processing system permease protein